jgi:hypothetical protein
MVGSWYKWRAEALNCLMIIGPDDLEVCRIINDDGEDTSESDVETAELLVSLLNNHVAHQEIMAAPWDNIEEYLEDDEDSDGTDAWYDPRGEAGGDAGG